MTLLLVALNRLAKSEEPEMSPMDKQQVVAQMDRLFSEHLFSSLLPLTTSANPEELRLGALSALQAFFREG